jgi:hypothetical protein
VKWEVDSLMTYKEILSEIKRAEDLLNHAKKELARGNSEGATENLYSIYDSLNRFFDRFFENEW